jgi:hypothetical protein
MVFGVLVINMANGCTTGQHLNFATIVRFAIYFIVLVFAGQRGNVSTTSILPQQTIIISSVLPVIAFVFC